jgi:hypothetical protein
MAARIPDDDRIFDLLATRAVEGLAPAEQAELAQLVELRPDVDTEAFDRVAASIALAGLRIEPMPDALRERLTNEAEAALAARGEASRGVVTQFRGAAGVPPPRRPAEGTKPSTVWGGWLAAAATLVLAMTGWFQVDALDQQRAALATRAATLEASVFRLEQALAEKEASLAALQEASPETLLAALAGRADTVVLPWTATEDPAARSVEGMVIWNSAEQAGLMSFRGLPPNDPAIAQYQLWIFDAERDDRFPVDGGVFDVVPGADETLVRIRASLPVGTAVLFAITVEPAGGVVVSSRERIALVAQPGA